MPEVDLVFPRAFVEFADPGESDQWPKERNPIFFTPSQRRRGAVIPVNPGSPTVTPDKSTSRCLAEPQSWVRWTIWR